MIEGPVRPVIRAAHTSQTLDRGLAVLELLSGHPAGLSVMQIARALGSDRAVIYRLVNTLLAHHLLRRADAARFATGLGVLQLAQSAFPDLQSAGAPELAHLAEATGATATLAVADGDEAVALQSVSPPQSALYITYRPGYRHPLTVGASGVAILAGRKPVAHERAAVAEARVRGYAISSGEIMPGASGVHAPIRFGERADASVGIVRVGELDALVVGPQVVAAARRIAEKLYGSNRSVRTKESNE